MSLAAGQLDQRISIEQRISVVNDLGEEEPTWSTLATVWARAEPLRGREYFAAAQLQGEVDVRFTIRHRTDVDRTMRVQWRGQAYDIVSPPIEPQGGREYLELMCVQGKRDGR